MMEKFSRSLAQVKRARFNFVSGFANGTNPIELEMLDVDLFRSKSLWRPLGARGVFGGQVCWCMTLNYHYDYFTRLLDRH